MWSAVTWQELKGTKIVVSAMATRWHGLLKPFSWVWGPNSVADITVMSLWVRWCLNLNLFTQPFIQAQNATDQRKHQSSASLAFVRGIHRWPVNSPHKWPVSLKMFPFDYVIMEGLELISDNSRNPNTTRDMHESWKSFGKDLVKYPDI